MTVDRWTRTVRHRLALGRLLPLGGARDGAWISEEAARGVLRHAARDLRGVRLGPVRIGLADPEDTWEPVVPPPPGALPPGPLTVTAECAATASEPLPVTAGRLRAVLVAAAEHLGLVVAEVDIRVTGLLDPDTDTWADWADVTDTADTADGTTSGEWADSASGGSAGDGEAGRVADAVRAVAGVSRLTGRLGPPVHIEERRDATGAALPSRHVRVEVAVGAGRPALEVAREVRSTVAQALADHPTVAVLVTSVG